MMLQLSVVTYFLPSRSLLIPTTGCIHQYIYSHTFKRCRRPAPFGEVSVQKQETSSSACSSACTECLSWCWGGAVRSQHLYIEIILLTPVSWPVGLIRLFGICSNHRGGAFEMGVLSAPWGCSVVGESSSPGALPSWARSCYASRVMQQGLSDLFWAGAFSSRVGWAWQTCSAC